MMPAFSLDAIVSIGIPLALLIICSENAQATGVLMAQGYNPPNNAMAIYGSDLVLLLPSSAVMRSILQDQGLLFVLRKRLGKKILDMQHRLRMDFPCLLRIICFTRCSFCHRHAECNCYCDCWFSDVRCSDQFTEDRFF